MAWVNRRGRSQTGPYKVYRACLRALGLPVRDRDAIVIKLSLGHAVGKGHELWQ
jgi:hypothetical protein